MLRVDARTGVQVSPDISRFVERERASELRLLREHGGIKSFGREWWDKAKIAPRVFGQFQFVGVSPMNLCTRQRTVHRSTGAQST